MVCFGLVGILVSAAIHTECLDQLKNEIHSFPVSLLFGDHWTNENSSRLAFTLQVSIIAIVSCFSKSTGLRKRCFSVVFCDIAFHRLHDKLHYLAIWQPDMSNVTTVVLAPSPVQIEITCVDDHDKFFLLNQTKSMNDWG